MTGSSIQYVARPPQFAARRTLAVPSTRFGKSPLESALKQGLEASTKIPFLHYSEQLNNLLKSVSLFSKDARVGGLSIEDIMARAQTLIGLYFLQTYSAFKDEKHPWETLGRNAVVWTGGFYLTKLLKSENFGVNTLFINPFMRQQGTPVLDLRGKVRTLINFVTRQTETPEQAEKSLGWLRFEKLIDWARLPVDYTEILEKAGLSIKDSDKEAARSGKKALWAASYLDKNRLNRVQAYYIKLKDELLREGLNETDLTRYRELQKQGSFNLSNLFNREKSQLHQKMLTTLAEKKDAKINEKLKLYKASRTFLKRVSAANLFSTAIIAAATIYVLGGLAIQFVYKFIAPMDKDFDPTRIKGYKPKAAIKPAPPPSTQTPSIAAALQNNQTFAFYPSKTFPPLPGYSHNPNTYTVPSYTTNVGSSYTGAAAAFAGGTQQIHRQHAHPIQQGHNGGVHA